MLAAEYTAQAPVVRPSCTTHVPHTHVPHTHVPHTHVPHTHVPHTHFPTCLGVRETFAVVPAKHAPLLCTMEGGTMLTVPRSYAHGAPLLAGALASQLDR